MSNYTHPKALSDVIITDIDGNEHHRECCHCCHCGKIWVVKPGSGKKRGFCLKCMQPTCGKQECDTCIPLEKKLGY